jgi:hypothetical protein
MKKSEDADFMEIFGSSSVAESLNADAPLLLPAPEPLPTDAAVWEFLDVPLGKAAREIQDAAFVQEISGFEPVPAQDHPDSLLEFSATDDFIKRVTAEVLTGPRHRAAMQLAVDRIRKSAVLAPIRDSPRWADLVSACTTFVAGELVAASGA